MKLDGIMNYSADDWEGGAFGRWMTLSIPEGICYHEIDDIDTAVIDPQDLADRIGGSVVQHGNKAIAVISAGAYIRIWDSSVSVHHTPECEAAEKIVAELEAIPKKRELFVRWLRMSNQGITSSNMPLAGASPKGEFYPWIGEPLESFWDQYMASDASVLLLIGAPGTGKTSFLRGMLRHTNAEAWITYDESVQRSEELYTSFASIEGGGYGTAPAPADPYAAMVAEVASNRRRAGIRRRPVDTSTRVLILEDSDQMLGARNNGNALMSRILNLADGLVQMPRRKVVFTTNLPNLSSVDEALLRPGRCFAVLNFRPLDRDEAVAAAAAVGKDRSSLAPGRYTLAQVLGDQKQGAPAVRKIGF